MKQTERTKRNEQAAKEAGLVKIHPLVPNSKKKEALDYCKSLRAAFKKESE